MKMVGTIDDSFRNQAMANWLGPVATWNARRRLIQLLRRAHQSLGIDRKRLGIGGVTLGAIMGSTALYLVPSPAFAQDAVCINPVTGTVTPAQGAQVAAAPGDQVVCGSGATAVGDDAVAVGADASANGDEALAFGADAEANGIHSVAIGSEAQALNTNAIAIGRESDALGEYAIGIGSGARATGNLGTAVGNNALARQGDTALGAGALGGTTSSGSTVAVGYGAGGGGGDVSRSTLVGAFSGANSQGAQNSFVGYFSGAVAAGINNVAHGIAAGAVVTGDNNVSIGNQAGTLAQIDSSGNPVAALPSAYNRAVNIGKNTGGLADDAVAIGTAAAAVERAVAVGTGASAAGSDGVAVGTSANSGATGYNVAIGAIGTSANANSTVEGAVAIGVSQSATGDGAVSLGSYNTANGDGSVAIGRANLATGPGSLAIGDSVTATGGRAVALGSTASAMADSGVALGNGAMADSGDSAVAIGRISEASGRFSIAMGDSAKALADDTLAFGSNARSDGISSIAIGTGSVVSGNQSIAIGVGHTITGNRSGAFGDPTNIDGDDSYAIGNNNVIEADQAFVLGNNVTIAAGTDRAVALGHSSNVTVADGVALGSGSVSNRAIAPTTGSIPAGSTTITYNTSDQTLLGAVSVGRSGAYRQITNVADGTAAQDAVTIRQLQGALTSFSVTATQYFHANSVASDSLAIGTDSIAVGPSTIVNGDNGIGMGNGAVVEAAAPGGTAIGQDAHVLLADGVALGTSSQAGGEQAVAIGAGATSDHFLGVALGAGSVTGPVVATASGMIDGTLYNYAGAAPISTVSVGAAGAERTITNVGAGRVGATSTDAINGSQLFAAQQAIEAVSLVANAGWNISAQGANASNVAVNSATGTSVDLNNSDGNIIVSKAVGSNDVTFDLAGDIAVDSVKTGDTKLDTNGVAIVGGPNGTVSLTGSGLDNGGNRITNVAAGINATDGVNVSQLAAAVGNVNIGFVGNSGGTVTRSSGQLLAIQGVGSTAGTYSGANVRTTSDPATGAINIELAEAPRFGTVTINENGTGKITGVTAATLSSTSTEAVNGSQLVALGDSIAATLSPGSTYNPATNTVNAQIVVGGNVYTNVQDAIQAVNANVGGGFSVTTAAVGSGVTTGTSVSQVAPGATATFTAGNNVMIHQNGSEVQVALNPNLTGIQSVSITGGPTINGNGIDMGGDRITNVGNGVASTDAVNLGQLNAGLSTTLSQANQYTDLALSNFRFDLTRQRRDANGGTAAAMAMSQVPQAFEPGMGIVGVGMSTWQGEQAVAFGMSKASDNGRVIVRATGSYNTRSQGGAAVGVGFQF